MDQNLIKEDLIKKEEILSRVDHTQLKAFSVWADIRKLCEEALALQTASVCIPPSFVARVRAAYPTLRICTVVGFPLGYSVTAAKEAEVRAALQDGADEIDMVVNIGDVKDHRFSQVEEEIRTLKKVCGDHILKVIVEACYLTEEEKIAMCQAVTAAGADFIKTSTGFGTGGATLEDAVLFRAHIGENVQIKAAGGVKTIADMEAFLQAGCTRIGTSSAAALFTGKEADSY